MAHLLSFIDTRPHVETPGPPEPSLPSTKSITSSPRSALLVENDESLLNLFRKSLKDEGYAVRVASNSTEGLRLYRDCAPFNVVIIDYCVPHRDGVEIDYCAPQTNGIELAMAIRDISPSQGIIIAAFDYRNAGEVPRPQELIHVPLLIDIGNFQLRSLLEKVEVDRAIESLTSSDLLRLQQFADFRVRGLGRAARGRTGEDLLAEALVRTLLGTEDTRQGRHWNKNFDFVMHLTGAMRSISSSWKRQFPEKEAYLISELSPHDVEGEEQSRLDDVASGYVAADQLLIERDEEDRVIAMFKDDLEAAQVFQALLNGLKKNEIVSIYGLNEKKYVAAVKRIRVKLLGRRNGGNGGELHAR
jgi:CheY-like chemotaxis protein